MVLDTTGGDLVLGEIADGDAIVFKEDSGEIKSGKVYFIRVKEAAVDDDDNWKYKTDVLKIFSNVNFIDDNDDLKYKFDEQLRVNGDLTSSQKYKIVNYFNLSKKDKAPDEPEELDHRDWTPVIDKLYHEKTGDDWYDAEGSTFNFPIIIGSKKLYLERPIYKDPETGTEFRSWVDTVWRREGDSFKVRANLEMSEIAQTFISDFKDHEELSSKYWKDENIFSSSKNLLSRSNTPIQTVDWEQIENEDEISVKVNVKLTKGKEYRCFFNNASDFISSVTINGIKKTISFCVAKRTH